MAILWKQYRSLATMRDELYDSCITYLLERRDLLLQKEPLLPANDAKNVLRPLCLWMQEKQRDDAVSAAKLQKQIKPMLRKIKPDLPAATFIDNLRERAGLLQNFGGDGYIFRHRSFREYLAACELADQIRRDPSRVQLLVDNFTDDWWTGTLLFAVSRPSPAIFDDFFAAFLPHRANTANALTLMRQIIQEGRVKSAKAFEPFVLNQQQDWQKRHNALEGLRQLGPERAKAVVKRVWEKHEKPLTPAQAEAALKLRQKAEEILIEWKIIEPPAAVIPERKAATELGIASLAERFYNPFELNAEYILIPGGKYKYSATKAGTELVEVPPLYFAKYPVTNKLYRRFIDYLSGKSKEEALTKLPHEQFAESLLVTAEKLKGFSKYIGKDPKQWAEKFGYYQDKRFNEDDQPVAGVNWFAANAYCQWLSELQTVDGRRSDRQRFRLPTEEEWEWAASGGKRKFPWGKEEPDDPEASGRANYAQKVGHTTPVGAYPAGATPEGLMDMAGNVWEWMENLYGKGAYTPEARAVRGGSWLNGAVNLQCATRSWYVPPVRFNNVGFRVVRASAPHP